MNESEISEEAVGSYFVKTMTITSFEGRSIVFQPMGSFVIGAYGRVDILLSVEKYSLIWVDKDFSGLRFGFHVTDSGFPSQKSDKQSKQYINLDSE